MESFSPLPGRVQSAYSKLLRYDIMGLALCFLGCFYLLFAQRLVLPLRLVSVIVLEICLLTGAFIAIIKLTYLSRFSIETKRICDLMALILKYKWWMRFSYTIGTSMAIIAVIIFFFVQGLYRVPTQVAIFSTLALVMIPIAYMEIRFFKKNVSLITKGLQELKEFEES